MKDVIEGQFSVVNPAREAAPTPPVWDVRRGGPRPEELTTVQNMVSMAFTVAVLLGLHFLRRYWFG